MDPVKKSNDPKVKEQSTVAEKPKDVVLVHGLTDDKQGYRVLRARNDAIEAGEVRPLKEGQPITSDVVKLHPRKEAPFLCDVETTLSYSATVARSNDTAGSTSGPLSGAPRMHPGPARVATQAYRDNWDAIWANNAEKKGGSELN